jgi:adenylyltransferase/sulfurtransferase
MDSEQHSSTHSHELDNGEIFRYSRQLLVPQIGTRGQEDIVRGSVLVVGAGGLGVPVLLYLAGAGVGRIGVVDSDVVELSNIHRQVLYVEASVGESKAVRAAVAVRALNSRVQVDTHDIRLDRTNARELVQRYDVVVDCSDNVPTRYLVNDACCLENRPLVSGSAIQLEGQITVYNHAGGPCYRCIFPRPSEPSAVTNCSDGGVLGPVVGVLGSLQALEALKLLARMEGVLSGRLLLFDARTSVFRELKLRPRRAECAGCHADGLPTQSEYDELCRGTGRCMERANDVRRVPEVSCSEYSSVRQRGAAHVLIDVRDRLQFGICALSGALNLPLAELPSLLTDLEREISACRSRSTSDRVDVFVICRRGVASAEAVQQLGKSAVPPNAQFFSVHGGLTEWAKTIDPAFPRY